MSVSESQRHQLFQWFEEAMGPERAAVMMDLLPPVGWTDLATKADVSNLGVELRSDTKMVEARIGVLEGKMEHGFGQMQKNIYLSMLASNVTVVGLVLAVMQVG